MFWMRILTPDHCTFWPDGMLELNWSNCCLNHDIAYQFGADRFASDIALYQCVAAQNHIMAAIMFCGLALFGWLFYRRNKD
jgi:hypothetical protein